MPRTGLAGDAAGEISPGDRARAGEVPDPGLAVDQEIERDVGKVGHVGRRHHIARSLHAAGRRKRPQHGEPKFWSSQGPKNGLVRMTSAPACAAITRRSASASARPYTQAGST